MFVGRKACNTFSANYLLQIITPLLAVPRFLLLCGDFNAPNINREEESASPGDLGRRLLDLAQTSLLTQHVREPTRFRSGTVPSVLDLIFTRHADDLADLTVHPPLAKSDHALLTATLTGSHAPPPAVKSHRSYRHLRLDDAIREATSLDWGADDLPVDELWRIFKTNVQSIVEHHVPLKKSSPKASPPWFKPRVRRALQDRNDAWALYKALGTVLAEDMYKLLRNRATEVVRECKDAYDLYLARSLLDGPKEFFAFLRRYKSHKSENPPFLTPTACPLKTTSVRPTSSRIISRRSLNTTTSGNPRHPLNHPSPRWLTPFSR